MTGQATVMTDKIDNPMESQGEGLVTADKVKEMMLSVKFASDLEVQK